MCFILFANSVNCRRFNCIKQGNVSLRRASRHLHAILHAISSWSFFLLQSNISILHEFGLIMVKIKFYSVKYKIMI